MGICLTVRIPIYCSNQNTQMNIDKNNAPLYEISVPYTCNKWYELLFINLSRMSVNYIDNLCSKLNQSNSYTGVIYWYRNLYNNKLYIGQTIHPKDRHGTHISSSNKNSKRIDRETPIHRAFRKYGIHNFEYRILCLVVEPDQQSLRNTLNKKEQYYINYYQSSITKNGYNILEGGNSSPNKGMCVNQCTKYGDYITTFSSITEATKHTGCKNISSAIYRKQYYANGYVFVPEGIPLPVFIFKKYRNLIIHQYSKEGKYITSFESALKAAKAVNGDQSRIKLCAQSPYSHVAYGFRWSHQKQDNLKNYVNA